MGRKKIVPHLKPPPSNQKARKGLFLENIELKDYNSSALAELHRIKLWAPLPFIPAKAEWGTQTPHGQCLMRHPTPLCPLPLNYCRKTLGGSQDVQTCRAVTRPLPRWQQTPQREPRLPPHLTVAKCPYPPSCCQWRSNGEQERGTPTLPLPVRQESVGPSRETNLEFSLYLAAARWHLHPSPA